MPDKYLGGPQVAELITALKTLLAGKADLSALDGYATPDAVATAITTALTNYATNTGVQTAITTALANYMTAAEVNEALVAAAGIKFEVVDELPDPDDATANVIYLVPSETTSDKNAKDEYMLINGMWELLGTTAIDLTGYWSKEELQPLTSEELQEMLQ